MSEFSGGEYHPDTAEDILNVMVEDAKAYWGEDLKDDELAIVRVFYEPVAELLAAVQRDIGTVLQSTQIDNAEGTQLDLLTALIGVTREPATGATGTVTFSRNSTAGTDYPIPEGTVVQTNSNSPTRYRTTESATLLSGTTEIANVPIESVMEGVEVNTSSNTLVVMPDAPAGIDSVTNPSKTIGGADEEPDDELRKRAKDELANGSRASAPALINAVKQVPDVKSVSIFLNDTSTDETSNGGLPDHAFELVVSGGDNAAVAQAIRDTKAAGDTSYAGVNGGSTVSASTDLGNGQKEPLEFSRPSEIPIYVDADIDITSDYAGDSEVQDRIVEYIGGLYASGNEENGELQVGDDLVFGEIRYAIRDVKGVHDINSLYVSKESNLDTNGDPVGTSNITIQDSEIAMANATDASLDIVSSEVTSQ